MDIILFIYIGKYEEYKVDIHQSTLEQNEKFINIFVRVFHWSLAFIFVILFVTGERGDGSDIVHIFFGYLLTSIIFSRIVWGFFGNSDALWLKYLHSPVQVVSYLRNMFKKGHRSYQLHNPAGSSMILVMILLLVILTSSGILVEAVFEFEGVLYFISNLVNDSQAVLIKKIHSLVAHIMLIVIALHIAGVIYSSYAYKVNMPLMMITGKINFFKNKEK